MVYQPQLEKYEPFKFKNEESDLLTSAEMNLWAFPTNIGQPNLEKKANRKYFILVAMVQQLESKKHLPAYGNPSTGPSLLIVYVCV